MSFDGAGETIVARDLAEHSSRAAELIARAVLEAVAARGVARVALSGGTSPLDAYRRLGALKLPFERIAWFWVDERAVQPDHARSNYGAAAKALELAGGTHGKAHRMEAEAPLREKSAKAYEALLRDQFGVASAVAFDVMTLGIGDDGHTASLFPRTGAARIADRLVAAIPAYPDRGYEPRLTLTAPVLREAGLALMIVRGASKRAVVEAARSPGEEDEVPARVLRGAKGRVVWLLDDAAARA